jgi:hypothetical protein
MKKYFTAAFLIIAVTAMGQQYNTGTRQNQTETKTQKQSTVKKTGMSKSSAMLDGKAFMITLNILPESGSLDNSKNTGTTEPSHEDRSMNQSTVPTGMTQNSGEREMNDKKMILRFENGMVRTSGKSDLKVSNCNYSASGSPAAGIQFNADCNSTASSMKNNSAGGRTYSDQTTNSVESTSGTEVNQNVTTDEYSTTTQATQNNGSTSGTSQSGSDMSATQSGTGTSAVSGTGMQTGSEMSSTDQYQRSEKSSVLLTGTVSGNAISGTISCTKKNGTSRKYSFTGSIADKNDLSLENDLGLK